MVAPEGKCVECGKKAVLRCPKCIEVLRVLTSAQHVTRLSHPVWKSGIRIENRCCNTLCFAQFNISEEKSSFCSQECFKGAWAAHKAIHADPNHAWLYWYDF